MSVVGVALLDVGLVRWDERPGADESMGGVERGPLFGSGDGHRARAATLGPRAFENDAIAPVCAARLEIDALSRPAPAISRQGKSRRIPRDWGTEPANVLNLSPQRIDYSVSQAFGNAGVCFPGPEVPG